MKQLPAFVTFQGVQFSPALLVLSSGCSYTVPLLCIQRTHAETLSWDGILTLWCVRFVVIIKRKCLHFAIIGSILSERQFRYICLSSLVWLFFFIRLQSKLFETLAFTYSLKFVNNTILVAWNGGWFEHLWTGWYIFSLIDNKALLHENVALIVVIFWLYPTLFFVLSSRGYLLSLNYGWHEHWNAQSSWVFFEYNFHHI